MENIVMYKITRKNGSTFFFQTIEQSDAQVLAAIKANGYPEQDYVGITNIKLC